MLSGKYFGTVCRKAQNNDKKFLYIKEIIL